MVFAIKSVARVSYQVIGTVNGVSTLASVRATSVREAIGMVLAEEPAFKALAVKPSHPVL